jgi:hypothetical protein
MEVKCKIIAFGTTIRYPKNVTCHILRPYACGRLESDDTDEFVDTYTARDISNFDIYFITLNEFSNLQTVPFSAADYLRTQAGIDDSGTKDENSYWCVARGSKRRSAIEWRASPGDPLLDIFQPSTCEKIFFGIAGRTRRKTGGRLIREITRQVIHSQQQ